MRNIDDDDEPITVEITAIWLRRIGNELHVCAEIDGEWRRVITELVDGNISHIAETNGIASAPLDGLTT
jgi:hypothetical protein